MTTQPKALNKNWFTWTDMSCKILYMLMKLKVILSIWLHNLRLWTKMVYLNWYELQNFIKNLKTMRAICTISRKSVHSLDFLMNSTLFFLTPHLFLWFRLINRSTLHHLIKGIAALQMIKGIHLLTQLNKHQQEKCSDTTTTPKNQRVERLQKEQI